MPRTKKQPAAAKPARPVGVVTHYYGDIGVAIVKFKKPVTPGATVRFQGHTTNFEQAIASLEYDHKPVKKAPNGKEVGMKVDERVREGDEVFFVES